MFYHIPFLKGASTQPRSLSPSSRAVCFMQYHGFSAAIMQIRKGSAARLAFHRHVGTRGSKSFDISWEGKEKKE